MKLAKEFINFGKFVKKARIQAGLTQNQLAKRLGYDTSQFVSNIERGLCAYPLNKFKKVAKILDCDLCSGLTDHFLKDEMKRIGKEIGI